MPLLSVAAHPGLSATNLQSTGPGLGHTRLPTRAKLSFFRIIGQPAARAALPILYAATAPDIADGGFYGPCEPGGIRGTPVQIRPASPACDVTAGRQLWEVSRELTNVAYPSLEPSAS